MSAPTTYSGSGRALEQTKAPGIYKRGSRYVVCYRDPRGRSHKRAAKTLAQAKVIQANLRSAVASGEYREHHNDTFAEYAPRWIDTYPGRTKNGIQPHTRDDYRRRLENDAIPFFGKIKLAAIEPQHLREYAERIAARGVSANTIRLGIAPVRALLATALDEGLIRSNPAAGLRLRRPDDEAELEPEDVDEDERTKALDPDELRALLDNVDEPWRPFFEFLAQTGLRIGEAIEVRYRDVDLGKRYLNVRRRYYRGRVGLPKGRKRRRIRLTEGTAHALLELRNRTNAGADDLVFTAEQGGRIAGSNLMARVLKPAAARAGLGGWVIATSGRRRAESWVGFHTFRHTCATMLFRQGWNAVQVQKFLGHSDPGFTQRTYVHLLPEDIPDPSFLDDVTRAEGGNEGATGHPETDREDEQAGRLVSVG